MNKYSMIVIGSFKKDARTQLRQLKIVNCIILVAEQVVYNTF